MSEAAPHAARGGLAMGSGFYLPKSDGTHQAFPVRGTPVSEASREPANLMNAADYPVAAECHWCHNPIRLAVRDQMEWRHIRPDAAGDAP